MYADQTDVLTKISNKWRAQKLKFSQLKNNEHQTRNMITTQKTQYLQFSFVPGTGIISHFTSSICRDPVGTRNVLPGELGEFWKRKGMWTATLTPAWCTQRGHTSPGKATQSCPCLEWCLFPPYAAAAAPSHLLLFKHTSEIHGMKHQGQQQPFPTTNLWGQSEKGREQDLTVTTKAEKLEHATFQKGAKSTRMPTGSRWRGGCAHGSDAPTETAQQDNNSTPGVAIMSFCSKSPGVRTYPRLL